MKIDLTKFFCMVGIFFSFAGVAVGVGALGIYGLRWANEPELVNHPLQERFQELENVQYFQPKAFRYGVGFGLTPADQVKDHDGIVKPLMVAKVKGDNEWRLWWGTESFPEPSSTVYFASPREGRVTKNGDQWTELPRRLVYVARYENGDEPSTERVMINGMPGPEFRSIGELVFANTGGKDADCIREQNQLRCETVEAVGDPLYIGCPMNMSCQTGWSVLWGMEVLASNMSKNLMSDGLRFVYGAAGRYVPVFSYYDERGGEKGVTTVMDGQESFLPFKDQTKPPSSPETTEL